MTNIESRRTAARRASRLLRYALAALAALAANSAAAALGAPADALWRDMAGSRGTALTRMTMGKYRVQEIALADGVAVREFVSPGGTVFATTWSGPSMPDLKLVLGTHYPRYAAQAQRSPGNGKLLSVDSGELVLRVVKLQRGLAGWAHVPALVPPGTTVDEIR